MIEDKFEIGQQTGDPDDASVEAICKDCRFNFTVQLNILKPKNCEHELGTALTIICPKCQIRATTTNKESHVASLKERIAVLKNKVAISNTQVKFGFLIKDGDHTTYSLSLECKRCGREFFGELNGGANSKWVEKRLVFVCPLCGNTDKVDHEGILDKYELVAIIKQIHKLETELAVLTKGNEHG